MTERLVSASLGNLTNQETMQFLVNQEVLEESLEADYEELSPLGLSHKRLQFKGTGNLKIPIEIYLSEAIQERFGAQFDQHSSILEKKAWLQSLLYPSASSDYSRVGPPRVLFVWPHVVRIVARVTRWSTTHRLFATRDLHTTALLVRMELVEDLDTRKLMDDVIVEGSLHVAESEV